MGVKEIFQEGIQELKRRTSLIKEKRQLQKKEKIHLQQLMQLGRKAWNVKLDLSAYENVTQLISTTEKQIEQHRKQLEDFEQQKKKFEEDRQQKNNEYDTQRKQLEERKKETFFKLEEQKKVLKDAQSNFDDAGSKKSDLKNEEEQLKQKNAGGQIPEQEKMEIQKRLSNIAIEIEDLEKKYREANDIINEVNPKIPPLEEELNGVEKEIDDLKIKQKEVIGSMDSTLSEIREKISSHHSKINQFNKEQEGYFGKLGEKLSAGGIVDEKLNPEMSKVKMTEKEMLDMKTGIEKLEKSETMSSRSAFWKMIGLVAGSIVVIIAVIITLTVLFKSKDKEKVALNNFQKVLEDTPKVPSQVADTLMKYKEKIARDSEKKQKQSKDSSSTFNETLNKIDNVGNDLKARSEQIQGKEIKVMEKSALISVLPELKGWRQSEPSYEKGGFGQLESSSLKAAYSSESDEANKIKVSIVDTATASALLHSWQVILQMNITRDDDKGYQKITRVGDIPVIERFDKSDQKAQLAFIIKSRYIIEISARGEESISLLKKIIPQFDFSRLE